MAERSSSTIEKTPLVPSVISHDKILEKLGECGLGVVYKAQDTKLARIFFLRGERLFKRSGEMQRDA